MKPSEIRELQKAVQADALHYTSDSGKRCVTLSEEKFSQLMAFVQHGYMHQLRIQDSKNFPQKTTQEWLEHAGLPPGSTKLMTMGLVVDVEKLVKDIEDYFQKQ